MSLTILLLCRPREALGEVSHILDVDGHSWTTVNCSYDFFDPRIKPPLTNHEGIHAPPTPPLPRSNRTIDIREA